MSTYSVNTNNVEVSISANSTTVEITGSNAEIELYPHANITFNTVSTEAGSTTPLAISGYTAGQDIQDNRVLALVNGLLYHADANNLDHMTRIVGMSAAAGLNGSTIPITTDGSVTYNSWSWTPTTVNKLFLGTDGLLVQTPDFTAKFLLDIATILTPTQILLDIQEPTQLNN